MIKTLRRRGICTERKSINTIISNDYGVLTIAGILSTFLAINPTVCSITPIYFEECRSFTPKSLKLEVLARIQQYFTFIDQSSNSLPGATKSSPPKGDRTNFEERIDVERGSW